MLPPQLGRAHQRIRLISPDQDIKRKSAGYGRQLLGQPPLYVAGSVIMDSFVNKLPDLEVGLSCFP